ncbi:phage terminase large subunit [Desertivirga xinjiangensis]|uniref:phage terminase large subunit n=1 Tax=Desertivirga xinjiangensis TaxID=539206 RepID=UPI00210E9CA6|nr:phage terminase large subunit [Pedobacter xinjiangensis]
MHNNPLSKQELIELLSIQQELDRRKATTHVFNFTKYTYPGRFNATWMHESYYSKLNDFITGKIKKLMVFMPPQHGKSEGSTRRTPAFILGQNPDKKIAVVCYNSTKARKFNREIQRIIDDPKYKELFPNSRLSTGSEGYARTNDEFEMVGHLGGLRSVGVGGPLTGETVDILVMDDLYKDAMSAWSPTIRENVQDWYDTVAETRLHNDSQQLLVFTRWHPDDLAGHLLETDGEDWEVVIYPAIKIGPPNEYDPRKEGEALYPEKHNLEKLNKIRSRNEHVFDCLYQQDPKSKVGLLYSPFKEYKTIPASTKQLKKAYIDTADTGADYLCSITYHENEFAMYVTDVIYTQDPMEDTEPAVAVQLTKTKTEYSKFESNNGGRGFARNVDREMRLLGNKKTVVDWFTQTLNKEVRIYTHSSEVTNLIIMPEGWDKRWPLFHKHVTQHMAQGGNEHDDAADVLTGMAENFGKVPMVAVSAAITKESLGFY